MSAGYKQTRLLFEQPAKPTRSTRKSRPATSEKDQGRQRRERHKLSILERLRQGKMTNGELHGNTARFGQNPRARISDLRKEGYEIRNTKAHDGTGLSWYELVKEPE